MSLTTVEHALIGFLLLEHTKRVTGYDADGNELYQGKPIFNSSPNSIKSVFNDIVYVPSLQGYLTLDFNWALFTHALWKNHAMCVLKEIQKHGEDLYISPHTYNRILNKNHTRFSILPGYTPQQIENAANHYREWLHTLKRVHRDELFSVYMKNISDHYLYPGHIIGDDTLI